MDSQANTERSHRSTSLRQHSQAEDRGFPTASSSSPRRQQQYRRVGVPISPGSGPQQLTTLATSADVNKPLPKRPNEEASELGFDEDEPSDFNYEFKVSHRDLRDSQNWPLPFTPPDTLYTVAEGEDLESEPAPSEAPLPDCVQNSPSIRNISSSASGSHQEVEGTPDIRLSPHVTPQPLQPVLELQPRPLATRVLNTAERALARVSITAADVVSTTAARAAYADDPRVLRTYGVAAPDRDQHYEEIEMRSRPRPTYVRPNRDTLSSPPHPGVRPMDPAYAGAKGFRVRTQELEPEQDTERGGRQLPLPATARTPSGDVGSTPGAGGLDATAPPDGGYLAWLQAIGIACVVFNCWGLNYMFGIQQAYYYQTLLRGRSASQISWIGSLQTFLLFFLAPGVGLLTERGYFRPLFHGGSVLLVIATFGMSWCTNYAALVLVQGILMGIAMGLTFASAVVVVGQYFARNLGVAASIGAAGSSVGGIAYCVALQNLMVKEPYPWAVSRFFTSH